MNNKIEILWQEKSDAADEKLNLLVTHVNAEKLLSVAIGYLCFLDPELQVGDQFGKHPAMIEALAKKLIPNFGNSTSTPITPQLLTECYNLLEEYVQFKTVSTIDYQDQDEQIEYHLRMASEIIRGNAYPEQTKKRILAIQGNFDTWFIKNGGIAPTKITKTIFSIIKDLEEKYSAQLTDCIDSGNKLKNHPNKSKKFENTDLAFAYGYLKKLISNMPKILPVELENYLTTEEANSLKQLIGVSKDNYYEDILIQRYPMYILPSGKVLFSDLSNLLDVVWEKFDLLAKSDTKFYQRYQKNRSKWLEEECVNILQRIFPKNCIFENLTYPDPDKESGIVELDIAVKYGPFLILFEAKSKQFRFESQRGNKKTLKTDIIDNVVEAFAQNLRTIKYINSNTHVTFKERNSERTLSFATDSIQKIYPISLSLFHLSGLGCELNRLKDLGLFLDNKFPFSICLEDLDLITRANIFPEAFLHYIEKRLQILSLEEDWYGDELSLFSAYLDTRLIHSNLFNDQQSLPDIIYTSSSPKFDELMLYERGVIDNPPDLAPRVPDYIKKITSEFKNYHDDSAKWIIFSLLDLDNNALYAIEHAIKDLSSYKPALPGKIRKCVIPFKSTKTVISLIASNDLSLSDLQNQNQGATVIEKYRHKANKSIGLGIHNNGSHNIISTACYISFEWEYEPDTEKLINTKPQNIKKKLGRNSPCPCGSKKKYKRCCLRN
ncbi:TPA: hypothetical protein F7146_10285 [Legionella pneumophila]|nr:hypothetical protein [Legionella pneumophila]